jgi:hypothetical protein
MRGEDLDRIELFLARVNKVTAQYRHGASIMPSAMATMANDQIEMEQWVKDRRAELVEKTGTSYNSESAPLQCAKSSFPCPVDCRKCDDVCPLV